MHKVKSRRRVSLTKWKKFWRNGRILSTRYYVTRPFRNSMPNRMFIINRLSGMAYEGLNDSNTVSRRVGGTRKMECLRLPLIWRHVFAATHSPISFSRLNRKKENGTNTRCTYWLVRGFWRDERHVGTRIPLKIPIAPPTFAPRIWASR